MALKSVAVQGDASASAGSAMYTGATSGSWTAGPVTETKYDVLTSGGKKVIYKAECSFSFVGENSGGSAVTGESSVTLEASGTGLQGGSTFVLVDGESANDSYGNTVSVSASAILQADK